MKNEQVTDMILDYYKKANAVVTSCTNVIQLEGALRYVKNLKRVCGMISDASKEDREFIKSSTDYLESTVNLKIKELN